MATAKDAQVKEMVKQIQAIRKNLEELHVHVNGYEAEKAKSDFLDVLRNAEGHGKILMNELI